MEREIKTFLLPNNLCRRAGIAAVWLPINQMSVFAYEKRNIHQTDAPSHFASSLSSSVFHLRQTVVLYHPVLRKLINESSGVFLTLQSLVMSKRFEQKQELLKFSRQYRSIIRACLENLQDETVHCNAEEKEELQNYITIFYSVECIWHICEILFIDLMSGNTVLPHLLEWIRFHFPQHERNAAIMLGGELPGLESKQDFWKTVIGLLLQGRVNVVRALLKQHSACESTTFKLVDQILRTMPVYNDTSGGISISEFNMQRRHWAMDVQSKIDARLFVSERYLHLIMKLVVGEEQAWLEVQDNCETWYEFLIGWLFYTEPSVKSFELGQFAKQIITKMQMKNRLKHLDRVILAAMEFDIFQVIKEIQYMTENGWFVSHFTDLLYHSNSLSVLEQEVNNFYADKLRESFILDYGITLMGHKSLWQIGLSYLDFCPNNGVPAIELLLPRIYFDNEAKTQKMICEAKNRDLNNIVQSICKTQGMLSMKHGRLGNALTWALKSQDGPFTSYLADKFLQEYIKSGKLVGTDLLDNLGSCMLASDRLIFLGKYFEFHKLYQARAYREAANLLISLLASKIIPKYFWYILLTEAIPLLECEELVFSSNDTFTIFHCLEDKETLLELKDTIDILRLAATRNLSRALTYEAQLIEKF